MNLGKLNRGKVAAPEVDANKGKTVKFRFELAWQRYFAQNRGLKKHPLQKNS